MTLHEIVTKMKQVEQIAFMDISNWDPRTLPGMQVKIGEAKRELDGLKVAYKTAISDSVAIVPVLGPPAKTQDFRDLLENEGGFVIVDYDVILRKFATEVEKSMDWQKRAFDWTQLHRLANEFNGYCTYDLKIRNIPAPVMDGRLLGQQVQADGMTEVIRKAIVDGCGSRFATAYIQNSLYEQAERLHFEGPVLTVVVFGLTELEVNDASFQPTFKSLFPVDLKKNAAGKNTLNKLTQSIQRYFKVSATSDIPLDNETKETEEK
jgi:hypothetical protein